MAFQQESLEDSMIFSEGPTSILDRLGYVKQLLFSKTRLEFRLLWNKIFQKEDEELGWLLNPYRQNGAATQMNPFGQNGADCESSYQYNYDDVSSNFGRERVTIYHRGVTKKSDRRRRRRREETKSLGDKALEYARYMGMGVYMTSTSFPSPFMPVNDAAIYDDTIIYGAPQNMYAMSKLW